MCARSRSRLRSWVVGCRLNTPGYCAHCKKSLSISKIFDAETAWCPQCREVVGISWFQLQSWVLGVVVLLAAGTSARLWA